MLGFFLGCELESTTVVFSGEVQDAPGNAGKPVEGATVFSQNRDGDRVGEALTDGDGAFAVDVPAGVSFFLTVEADAYVPTGFSGVAGLADFESEAGLPWLATPEWLAEQKEAHAECTTAGDVGTLVTGQALMFMPTVADSGSWPALAEVEVEVHASDGGTYAACYLDDDGVSLVEASGTGGTGEFAVFGVPAGGINVKVTVVRSNGESGTDVFEYVAPTDGVIPIFPTALEI